MAFLKTIRKFATSPEGRKAFAEAQKLAKDPATRRKIDEARRRLGRAGARSR